MLGIAKIIMLQMPKLQFGGAEGRKIKLEAAINFC
jgi:hypothetical protein